MSFDGKTLRTARDGDGKQIRILGTFGHDGLSPYSLTRTMVQTSDEEFKRTIEIGVFSGTLNKIRDIVGIGITMDNLPTQRKPADCILQHCTHFIMTAKGNQKTLMEDMKRTSTTSTAANPAARPGRKRTSTAVGKSETGPRLPEPSNGSTEEADCFSAASSRR